MSPNPENSSFGWPKNGSRFTILVPPKSRVHKKGLDTLKVDQPIIDIGQPYDIVDKIPQFK